MLYYHDVGAARAACGVACDERAQVGEQHVAERSIRPMPLVCAQRAGGGDTGIGEGCVELLSRAAHRVAQARVPGPLGGRERESVRREEAREPACFVHDRAVIQRIATRTAQQRYDHRATCVAAGVMHGPTAAAS